MPRELSWKAVADQLAQRMVNHAYCDTHTAAAPDPDCPFCADRAALQVWKRKARIVPQPAEPYTLVRLADVPPRDHPTDPPKET